MTLFLLGLAAGIATTSAGALSVVAVLIRRAPRIEHFRDGQIRPLYVLPGQKSHDPDSDWQGAREAGLVADEPAPAMIDRPLETR